jgi:hypothetical protein
MRSSRPAGRASGDIRLSGSFSEIVVVDYIDETILLGHDGPFHVAISEGKPICHLVMLSLCHRFTS